LKTLKMESISSGAAYGAFLKGLKSLISSKNGYHQVKACLVCDHLLEWNNNGYIPKMRLKALQKVLSGKELCKHLSTEGLSLDKSVYNVLKKYYSYRGKGYEIWMKPMFLSPRAVFDSDIGFNCCKVCVKMLVNSTKPYYVKLPKYAIANGAIVGDAPVELTSLNDVELALVSIARIDKHIFTFYGGAHKSVHGWHNLQYMKTTSSTLQVLYNKLKHSEVAILLDAFFMALLLPFNVRN
jgi:hypothetical protein